jgi:hypothetical protein
MHALYLSLSRDFRALCISLRVSGSCWRPRKPRWTRYAPCNCHSDCVLEQPQLGVAVLRADFPTPPPRVTPCTPSMLLNSDFGGCYCS